MSLGDGGINPSFHTSTNGEHSQDTNLESAMENLNESNHQLLQTIEELKAENVKLRLFINIAEIYYSTECYARAVVIQEIEYE